MKKKDQERYQREYEELTGAPLEPQGGFVDDDAPAAPVRKRPQSASRAADRKRRLEIYEREKAKERKRARRRRTWITVLAILLLLVAAGWIFWHAWARKPEVKTAAPVLANAANGENVVRGEDTFTLLVAGTDKAAGLTDTILLGKFDAKNHSAHFYSIPRDTCVNEDWATKKVNQYYSSGGGGADGAKAMIAGMKKLLGFEVDHYMIIDLEAFIDLVDTIGGVEFDVPIDMNYDDPWQDLSIHVSAGPQTLNGHDAMGVWRYRKTYANGDIGRLDVQHDLLKAVVKQTLTLGNIRNLDKIINIISRRVETDLSAGNLAYFAQQFLQMDEDKVTFNTAPGNYNGQMNKLSYVFLYPEEWLQCVNNEINPYSVQVSLADTDIVYESGSGLASTSGQLARNFP